MNRIYVLGLALGAFALPAAAGTSIRINIAHLSAHETQSRIEDAAERVCRAEYSNVTVLEDRYDVKDCIEDTTAAAEAQLAARKDALAKL